MKTRLERKPTRQHATGLRANRRPPHQIRSSTCSDETFAGSAGNLSDNGRSATRVTFDTLLSNGFEPQQDMEGVSQTGLCRVGDPPRGSRTWPVVVPSVELYGRIAGWRIEDKADAVAAGADGAAAIAEKAEMCEILDRNVYEPYRWQFSPQHEKAAALEHRLAELTYSIAANSGQPLDKMSVGRICLDGAESGRINAASVALELPAEAGRTTRLQLDLREVPSFGVFPGQVVGVQGAAPTNDKIIVSSVFADGSAPRAQVPYTTAAALHSARSGGGPVRVWVASGPFTSNANLEFEHLQAVIDQAEEAKPAPDVLILQGPFVDVDHPMAKTGGIEYTGVPVTYKTLWQEVCECVRTPSSRCPQSCYQIGVNNDHTRVSPIPLARAGDVTPPPLLLPLCCVCSPGPAQ